MTPWGEELDPDEVLPEYPRPQLVRGGHLNLNGRWRYAFAPAEPDGPEAYDGEIIVPFSPESPLSGVNRRLLPGETLWYRREFDAPDLPNDPDGSDRSDRSDASDGRDGRVLLHFGAVDQWCRVTVNGAEAGTHDGGYLPFAFDVTGLLRDGGPNTLVVEVRDPSDTGDLGWGKQKLERGGIWYTAQSGIWQTVWAERVPNLFVERLTFVPHLDDSCVEVTVHAAGGDARVTVEADGRTVARAQAAAGTPVRIPLDDVHAWTPEDPFLYDVTVELGDDTVTSYFGMRSFGVGPDENGIPRLLLNGRPYFHAGVLDQGYWPDGMYTAPSDAALVHDIATMKRLGFTMLRKHIKVEPLRWYHHCDRLGILVWQDFVSGGGPYRPEVVSAPAFLPVRLDDSGERGHRRFGRADAAARERFRREMRETVEHLRSVVSIAVWVPFNEGWGQFDAADVAREVAELDPTRTVDHASGWHDQGAGDLRSLHVYFRRFRVPRRRDGRVLVLSEYGGYNLRLDGHAWNDEDFGYRRYHDAARFGGAFARLHALQIVPAIPLGLSATVYTQLSDVEDELNGLLTYDRKVCKLPERLVRGVNRRLNFG
ncbi:glycoside hydrolase family 2 protein [Actinomadura sp. CNU-125]|uniref:glycoside hydrolase family 2 protein n=1 Tax=Actinomadura sp. CNU-125 TaxID=1904961 RepID=UPI0021CD0E61|nr:sugar-binding domain-containing protein [Actinomadura sp. CNU-125]